MLELTDLRAGYDGREILHGVTLRAEAGQVLALLGPNGCGKSTLLKALDGLIPSTGARIFDGVPAQSLSRTELARHVSYLPQGKAVPEITAGRLVLHGRFPYLSYPRRYGREDIACARAAMEKLSLADEWDTPMAALSGGMRQRVYIAMALAQGASNLLLDEPTTYLDIAHRLQLLRLTRALAREGKTVVMVLHELPQALEYADRAAVLHDGALTAVGTPEEIFTGGALNEAFGVRISRFRAGSRWRYYYEEGEEP